MSYILLLFHNITLYLFYLPIRKQTAYKQATMGPTALHPFWGTTQSALLPLPADLNRGTSRLWVVGFIHSAATARTHLQCVNINWGSLLKHKHKTSLKCPRKFNNLWLISEKAHNYKGFCKLAHFKMVNGSIIHHPLMNGIINRFDVADGRVLSWPSSS